MRVSSHDLRHHEEKARQKGEFLIEKPLEDPHGC